MVGVCLVSFDDSVVCCVGRVFWIPCIYASRPAHLRGFGEMAGREGFSAEA